MTTTLEVNQQRIGLALKKSRIMYESAVNELLSIDRLVHRGGRRAGLADQRDRDRPAVERAHDAGDQRPVASGGERLFEGLNFPSLKMSER